MQTEAQIDEVIARALAEDLGSGDVTTEALIDEGWQGKARIVVKAAGVLAGIEIAKKVFLKVDPEIRVSVLIPDGAGVKPGDIAASVAGKYAGILKAERTAINFLQHLSGIATETASYVAAVSGLPVKILDTRKTLPGLRMPAKYAVRMGGGQNHRTSLGDGILIKDNHLSALTKQGLRWKEVIAQARREVPGNLKIEVEVRTPEEASRAAEAGAHIILLDNMNPETMRRAVGMIRGRARTEASGGITLANVRAVAETGVDFISVGAITHSARALDISLDFDG